jgi:quinoprotein glucose dehydrogenase
MPWIVSLVERAPLTQAAGGEELYTRECAGCHGPDRKGQPPTIPSLVNLTDRLTIPEIRAAISDGGGRMAGFGHLGSDALGAIQRYLTSSPPDPLSGPERGDVVSAPSPEGRGGRGVRVDQKYRVQYERFLDPDGYPAVKPPWGTLSAIDLNTGKYVWKVPLGEYRTLAAQGMAGTGCENYGGPVVTAGGLVFIGATNYDDKLRAFDKATGELLWETTLPAAGNATPAVYDVGGRQFVAIATSSGKSKGRTPARYVAFALERQ